MLPCMVKGLYRCESVKHLEIEYPGLFRWGRCNNMDPYKSQAGELELVVSDVMMEVRRWCSVRKGQGKQEASISLKKKQ